MSDVQRRQTRERAMMIGACAAVFAFAGPLIGHRFDVQKTEEAYRADALQLAQSMGAAGPEIVQHVSFTNKAAPTAMFQSVTVALETPSDVGLAAMPLRTRDAMALRALTTFTAQNLGSAHNEETELDCLAEAIYYEARSEDLTGQIAVAEVVMNRVRSPHFPKTVCGVVFQGRYRDTGCQFTFSCDGSYKTRPAGESWDRARAVAMHVAMGLATPVTNKATHYHTDYVNPYWSAGLVETTVIGTHIFYRFPNTSAEWRQARIALAAQNGDDSSDLLEGTDAEKLAAAQLMKISAEPASVQPIMAPAIVPAASTADSREL